jgi:hypothetical protein
MILEYELDYRSSSQIYEKIFLRTLRKSGLRGKIVREDFCLKLYIESENIAELEEFATLFADALPGSIFLYDIKASIIDEMPDELYKLSDITKPYLSFCPECMKRVSDPNSEDYFNIFTECEVCGYGACGERRSYKDEIDKIAMDIISGKIVRLGTFYGTYCVGLPSKISSGFDYDLMAYDLSVVARYTDAKEYELSALGAIEKPFVSLVSNRLFSDTFKIERRIVRFKLPDDLILYLLMKELDRIGREGLLFFANECIDADVEHFLVEPVCSMEPIELVVSKKHRVILRGEKGLPIFSRTSDMVSATGALYSIIKEHKIYEKEIAGLFLSREYGATILANGKKYGTIEYLRFDFAFDSMADIFIAIIESDENGKKLVYNYMKKFPQIYNEIYDIEFTNNNFGIYELWGVVALVLGYGSWDDLQEAAHMLESEALLFSGLKGPRIDYKKTRVEQKVSLDPLMTIRTAMSYKLAGAQRDAVSYGVIESFAEFITNELDDMKQSMGIQGVAIAGSMLSNRKFFDKLCLELDKNHDIYFNNELPIEGRAEISSMQE